MEWYKGNEWNSAEHGLRKKVLDINFQRLEKPTEVSKVVITIREILNVNGRSTCYLKSDYVPGKEQLVEMGSAQTPIDCYVEKILMEMIVGETAQCFIQTKGSGEISFILTLNKINEGRHLFTFSVKEIYEQAQKYKENGVIMFKNYPQFAHYYFARAAKLMISYKPFHDLKTETDGIDGKDMKALLVNIQTNLAACLLQQKRYEHVLHITEFVETMQDPSVKSCYRRAMAFYNIKEFEAALAIIKKVQSYEENKDFAKLHANIITSWKTSKSNYKNVMQRMFKN